jgi:hypothetical protein
MTILHILERIESSLSAVKDNLVNHNDSVLVKFDEYLKMRRVYDDHKDKNYQITLTIVDRKIIEEDGKSTQISSLSCSTKGFPDDTETKLTEIYQRVFENAAYVAYLENKLKDTKVELAKYEKYYRETKEEVKEELKALKHWWQRG